MDSDINLMKPVVMENGTFENPFKSLSGLPQRGSMWRFMKERWSSSDNYKIPAEVCELHVQNLPYEVGKNSF